MPLDAPVISTRLGDMVILLVCGFAITRTIWRD
jgi:hypothetical protein